MTESPQTFLVVADDTPEMPVALRYAARRARRVGGRVALLSVVEMKEIEAWGGVERALMDEAFGEARKKMAEYEKLALELSGAEPLVFYRKGEQSAALLALIEEEPSLAILVMASQTKEGGRNPLLHYLTSDKGLKNLKIPLLIVPDLCRCEECG